jgi:phage tail-like protein
MTCGPQPTTFRILGPDAGWELDLAHGSDIEMGGAIELARVHPDAIDPAALARVMPPPWIARGCGACEWLALAAPEAGAPMLVRFAPGGDGLTAIACHVALIAPVAVAAARGLVAVLDAGRGELLVLSPGGERVVAAIPCGERGPIAFAGRAILVADGREVAAYRLADGARRQLAPAPGPIVRLAAARGGIWAAIDHGERGDAELALVRSAAGGWRPAPLAALLAAARDTGLTSADDRVACVLVPRAGLAPLAACLDRRGRLVAPPPPARPPARHTRGVVLARPPIDSGIARCRWHRVRIDLELPERTGLEVAVATVEPPRKPIAELTDADWQVADADWQIVDAGPITSAPAGGGAATVCDFLIDQPPGRYLALRLRLRGDGARTPRIRRIRLDFPRSTSAARLPGVYREDPRAADFLERFVSLFDASIEDLDRVIERFPALIDPAGAPAEALPWLGTFLDLALDPAWPEATRRALLAEAPERYRRRGTPRALARAIELVTGLAPAIRELGGAASPFGRLGRGARVGEARLFGRARTRLRLGASALGAAPLHSYGDPDRDHVAALGWRIAVAVPAGADTSPAAALRLARVVSRLVDAQKPAHVAASVRVGEGRALVGIASAVGIDTRLGGLPPSHLGTTTLLRRRTVLARGPRRGGANLAVGTSSAVAIQTVLS